MRHIGNDIVDLNAPENKGKSLDRRFLDRVFTPEERLILERAEHPDPLVWILWAGKEGAYKAISKDHPRIPSIPRLYNVQLAESPVSEDETILAGTVATPEGDVGFRTLLTPWFVHCVAVSGASSLDGPPVTGILHLGACEDASGVVRQAACLRIASALQVHPKAVEIRRRKTDTGCGAPQVVVAGIPSDRDISLSHDGAYGAFVLSH